MPRLKPLAKDKTELMKKYLGEEVFTLLLNNFNRGKGINFDKFISHCRLEQIVESAFVWKESVQGYDYWKSIDRIWNAKLLVNGRGKIKGLGYGN